MSYYNSCRSHVKDLRQMSKDARKRADKKRVDTVKKVSIALLGFCCDPA